MLSAEARTQPDGAENSSMGLKLRENNVLTSPAGLCVSTSASGLGVRKLLITIITSASIAERLLGDIRYVPIFPHMDFFAPHNLSGRYYCLVSFTHEEALFREAVKSLQMVTAAMKLKDAYSLEGKL